MGPQCQNFSNYKGTQSRGFYQGHADDMQVAQAFDQHIFN